MAIKNVRKTGKGWLYDDPGLTYDGATDPTSGLPVYYDAEGTTPVITNVTKHNA